MSSIKEAILQSGQVRTDWQQRLRSLVSNADLRDPSVFSSDYIWLQNFPALIPTFEEVLHNRFQEEEESGRPLYRGWYYTFLFQRAQYVVSSPWRLRIYQAARQYAIWLDLQQTNYRPEDREVLQDLASNVGSLISTSVREKYEQTGINLLDFPLAAALHTLGPESLATGNRSNQADLKSSLLAPKAIRVFLEALDARQGAAGRVLEWLAELLFVSSGGYLPIKDRSPGSKVGPLVAGFRADALLLSDSFFGDYRDHFGPFTVCECKDYIKRVDISRVGKFIGLMEAADIQLGILFALHGVTGDRKSKGDASVQALRRACARGNRFVIVVTRADLQRLVEEEISWPSLMQDLYVKTRLEQ